MIKVLVTTSKDHGHSCGCTVGWSDHSLKYPFTVCRVRLGLTGTAPRLMPRHGMVRRCLSSWLDTFVRYMWWVGVVCTV